MNVGPGNRMAMIDERTAIAARNNALLCAAVVRAQGRENRFADGFWHSLGRSLPFYPSVVTLSPTISPMLIDALMALPAGASVKDSFGTLNLSAQGFRKLFDARWLWRPATNPSKTHIGEVIRSPEGLAVWCRAWGDQGPDIFSASLLQDPKMIFSAVPDGDAIEAGFIVNRGPDQVAGISNLFGPDGGRDALTAAVSRFGDSDLVGYEGDGDQIEMYLSAGFEPLGTLAIYLKE